MPGIVQLRRQPYLIPWNARVFDTLPDFGFVAICKGCVDVTVTFLESDLDGVAHFVRFALPGAQANCWDLVTGVEREGLPKREESAW